VQRRAPALRHRHRRPHHASGDAQHLDRKASWRSLAAKRRRYAAIV
jgi:hypothetical protein